MKRYLIPILSLGRAIGKAWRWLASRPAVRRADSWLWYQREQRAKSVLARSYRHVTMRTRIDAARKARGNVAGLAPLLRAWLSSSERN